MTSPNCLDCTHHVPGGWCRQPDILTRSRPQWDYTESIKGFTLYHNAWRLCEGKYFNDGKPAQERTEPERVITDTEGSPQKKAFEIGDPATSARRYGYWIPVVPCHTPVIDPEGKILCSCEKGYSCQTPGKHTRTQHGYDDASMDQHQISAWWETHPESNIGVRVGKKEGIFEVDVDAQGGGDLSLQRLEKEYGSLPESRRILSGLYNGQRSMKILFVYPRGMEIPYSQTIAPGLEVHGDGHGVIFPPSLHKTGVRYEWLDENAIISDPPEWLIKLIQTGETSKGNKKPFKLPEKKITTGERHAHLRNLAAALSAKGMIESEIFTTLCVVNKERCDPPVSEERIRTAMRGAEKFAPEPEETETDSVIRDEAMKILTEGWTDEKGIIRSPVEYMVHVLDTLHVGDTTGKYFHLTIPGCALSISTDGININDTGRTGTGKSHLAESLCHTLPKKKFIWGSLTDNVIWYLAEKRPPGLIMVLDDAQTLTPSQISAIKQITTKYQEGARRYITDLRTKEKVIEILLPPRLAFIFTSVEGGFDEQLLDRTMSVNADGSEKQDDLVHEFDIERVRSGRPKFPETHEVKVMREMWTILFDEKPMPVALEAIDHINFIFKRDRRLFPLFKDSIIAFACINQKMRNRNDNGDLLPEKADFDFAMKFWNETAAAQHLKYNDRELQVLDYLVNKGLGTYRQKQVETELKMSQPDMHRALRGRKIPGTDDYAGGLVNKLPGIVQLSQGTERIGDITEKYTNIHYHGDAKLLETYQAIAQWID